MRARWQQTRGPKFTGLCQVRPRAGRRETRGLHERNGESMKRAIILAAGKGERLVNGLTFPKPLKRVAGVPLIVRAIRNLERAGVDEVVVIIGYLGDVLKTALSRYRFDLKLTFVEN